MPADLGVQKPVSVCGQYSGPTSALARLPVGHCRYLASVHWCLSLPLSYSLPPLFPPRPSTPLVSPRLPTVMDVDHEVKLLREEIMRLGTKDAKGVTRYVR